MPALSPGDPVTVRPDAPLHPGQSGTVMVPETHGERPGYWIVLAGTGQTVWFPEGALVAEAGEVR